MKIVMLTNDSDIAKYFVNKLSKKIDIQKNFVEKKEKKYSKKRQILNRLFGKNIVNRIAILKKGY